MTVRFEVFDSICKLKGPVYLVPILSHEDHEGHEAADHTAPRRGRPSGGRRIARRPSASHEHLSAACAWDAARSIRGEASPAWRLSVFADLRRYLISCSSFSSWLSFSSWSPINLRARECGSRQLFALPYSCRSALTGSTRVAASAGRQDAMRATHPSSAKTPA